MAEMVPLDASSPSSCAVALDLSLREDDGAGADFMFVESEHPSRLLEGLNSQRLANAFCDVVLICGAQEFPCHRNVLASFSPYFQVGVGNMLASSHKS